MGAWHDNIWSKMVCDPEQDSLTYAEFISYYRNMYTGNGVTVTEGTTVTYTVTYG